MVPTKDLEAKIVILGASNVGKTTLLSAYLADGRSPSPTASKQHHPPASVPTVGASFQTKRLISPPDAPDTTLRLQIWDTAGQERFRSISRLYYRGADAALLCYDVTDDRSFADMGRWMSELRANCGPETIVHVVGTKADIVAADPARRQVPFERCIQYVAEHLQAQLSPALATRPHSRSATPASRAGTRHSHHASASSFFGLPTTSTITGGGGGSDTPRPPSAPFPQAGGDRNSGFWGYADWASWDCCHEISAKDGEGVDEVFRVITRKLIEQYQRRERAKEALETPGFSDAGGGTGGGGYFEYQHGGHANGGLHGGQSGMDARGSFRLTNADRRRNWLGAFGSSYPGTPGTPGAWGSLQQAEDAEVNNRTAGGRCC
ncbi:hypothetical protein FH972_022214 [Carpinus fangiana]|uniref:Uncharacterized protein n=1 Tax=Carpinus fangiana TaxID=176857 RepID=A0A5N6KTT8_9ROSI|nr:hypothetical protein FH972_022214 [Carpinus fangiana]